MEQVEIMEKVEIQVSLRPSYGKGRYYPENNIAKAILLVCGQSTFTEEQLNILENIGGVFEVIVIQEPRDGFKRGTKRGEKK